MQERARLKDHEESLAEALKNHLSAGDALLMIKREKLYRAQYETFEEYCAKRWNLGQPELGRLIRSAVLNEIRAGKATY